MPRKKTEQTTVSVTGTQRLTDSASDIASSMLSAERSVFRSEQPRSTVRKMRVVRPVVSDAEQEELRRQFPEYQLNFTGKTVQAHAYAAASRMLEGEVLLDKIGDISGKIVDVGGNWVEHLINRRLHVHSCCPILDYRDAARQKERELRLEKFESANSANQRTSPGVELYRRTPDQVVCHLRSEECKYKAKAVMFLHSTYDIPFDSLAKIMYVHQAEVAYGCFVFSPQILLQDSGRVAGVNAYFEVDRKRNSIRFTFVGDGSNGYEHDYSQYLMYLARTTVVYAGQTYYYELQEFRAGIQFFKLIHCELKPAGTSRLFRHVWLGLDGLIEVRLFDYGTDISRRIGTGDVSELSCERVFLPEKLVYTALEYAYAKLTSAHGEMKTCDLFNYLRSFNNRVIICGTNVSVPESVGPQVLQKLASVLFITAYVNVLRQERVVSSLRNHAHSMADLLRKSNWRLMGYVMQRFFAGKDHRFDIQRDGPSLRTWLLEHCREDFTEHIKEPCPFVRFSEVRDLYFAEQFRSAPSEFIRDWARIMDLDSSWFSSLGTTAKDIVRTALSTVVGALAAPLVDRPPIRLEVVEKPVIESVDLIDARHDHGLQYIMPKRLIDVDAIVQHRFVRGLRHSAEVLLAANALDVGRIDHMLLGRPLIVGVGDNYGAVELRNLRRRFEKVVRRNPNGWKSANPQYQLCGLDAIWQLVMDQIDIKLEWHQEYAFYRTMLFHLFLLQAVIHPDMSAEHLKNFDMKYLAIVMRRMGIFAGGIIAEPMLQSERAVIAYFSPHEAVEEPIEIWIMLRNEHYYYYTGDGLEPAPCYGLADEIDLTSLAMVEKMYFNVFNQVAVPKFLVEDLGYRVHSDIFKMDPKGYLSTYFVVDMDRSQFSDMPRVRVVHEDSQWQFVLTPAKMFEADFVDDNFPWMQVARLRFKEFLNFRDLEIQESLVLNADLAALPADQLDRFKRWVLNMPITLPNLELQQAVKFIEVDVTKQLSIFKRAQQSLNLLQITTVANGLMQALDWWTKLHKNSAVKVFNYVAQPLNQFENFSGISVASGFLNADIFSAEDRKNFERIDGKIDVCVIDLVSVEKVAGDFVSQLVTSVVQLLTAGKDKFSEQLVVLIRISMHFEFQLMAKILNCFSIVEFVKPVTSSVYDSEIFIVAKQLNLNSGIGFKAELDGLVMQILAKRPTLLRDFQQGLPPPDVDIRVLRILLKIIQVPTLNLPDFPVSEMSVPRVGGGVDETSVASNLVEPVEPADVSVVTSKSKAKKRRERRKRMVERMHQAKQELVRVAVESVVQTDQLVAEIGHELGDKDLEPQVVSVLDDSLPLVEVDSGVVLQSVSGKSEESDTLKIYSASFKRQDARVSEYHMYLEAERLNVTSTAVTIYKALSEGSYEQSEPARLEFEKTYKLYVLLQTTHAFIYTPAWYNTEQISGSYDVCYDGERFRSIRLIPSASQKPWYSVPSTADFVIVFEDLRVYQCDRLLKTVFRTPFDGHGASVSLVEGVPGSGKTTEIIQRARQGDIILTVARRTKDEIQSRITALDDKSTIEVRTVDSYLINSKTIARNVYLDEGLMLHPGQIDLVAAKSRAKALFVFGDRAQLNFISRVGGFDVKFSEYTDFANYEFRNVTYRCPQDVAAVLFSKYSAGMYSKSSVRKSMRVQPITSLSDVPKNKDVKYLVYTQQEKHDLMRRGYNVNTIHECQGMTFRKVAVVRIVPLQLALYDSVPHGLVAVSRHTESLVYYTVAAFSTVAKDSVWTFVTAQCEIGHVTNFEKAAVMVKRAFKTANVHEKDFVTEVRPVTYCLEVKPDRDEVARTPQIMNVMRQLSLKLQIFPASRWSVDRIRTELIATSMYIPPIQPYEFRKSMNSADIVAALQMFYDTAFPQASGDWQSFDELQIETSELNVYLNDVRFSLSHIGETVRKTEVEYSYLPRLRTGQPNARPRTVRQDLLALAKRNCDVPRNNVAIDEHQELWTTYKAFLRTYCIPGAEELLWQYRQNPVTCDEETLMRWLNEQEPEKISKIDLVSEFNAVLEFVRYEMMIKTEAKNKLDPTAIFEYLPVQNIVFHRPIVNALMGSIFKILFDRFQTILKPNVFCLLKKSLYELQVHLNLCLVPGREYDRLEIDFSKFDKSQARMCHLFEMFFWEQLGMDQYLNGLWRAGHYTTSALDFSTGVKAFFLYQRKSGDAATAFGNTLVAMASLARAADVSGFATAMFVGDDSLLYFPQRRNFQHVVKHLADIYNLTAKVFQKKYGYFCSAFIIPHADGYIPVPDPLKRVERLGRGLVGVDNHGLKDRHTSFAELMQSLLIVGIDDVLVEAMAERYMIGPSFHAAMTALRHLVIYCDLFVAMYKPQQSILVSKLKKLKNKLKV